MSMSTYLVGFKPADEKFRKMRDAYKACSDAGVAPPREVIEFFGGSPEESDDAGVRVALASDYGTPHLGVTKWKAEMSQGFEVDLRTLDPSIKVLRFYNSH